VGHASGRWIAEILEKSAAELTAEDYAQMCKTIGFIRRHLAQEPANPVTSNWRYSLMNWGHDPLKGKAGDKDGVTAEIAMHRDKAVSAIIAEAKSALENPA